MGTVASSGTLNLYGIQQTLGGSNPIGMNEFYGRDPYKPMPSSGTIGMNDFYGANSRTASITSASSHDTGERFGWSQNAGSSFYIAESGQSSAAFGSSTKSVGLSTSGEICAITIESQEPMGFVLTIAARGNSNSGWTTLKLKCTGGGNMNNSVHTFTRTAANAYVYLSNTSPAAYAWQFRSQYSNVMPIELYYHAQSNRGFAVSFT